MARRSGEGETRGRDAGTKLAQQRLSANAQVVHISKDLNSDRRPRRHMGIACPHQVVRGKS